METTLSGDSNSNCQLLKQMTYQCAKKLSGFSSNSSVFSGTVIVCHPFNECNKKDLTKIEWWEVKIFLQEKNLNQITFFAEKSKVERDSLSENLTKVENLKNSFFSKNDTNIFCSNLQQIFKSSSINVHGDGVMVYS